MGQKEPSQQFNVTMPRQYVDRLKKREDETGLGRSEQLRRAMDAADARSPSAVEELHRHARDAYLAAAALRRHIAAAGAAAGYLDKIETAIQKITELAGAPS